MQHDTHHMYSIMILTGLERYIVDTTHVGT